MRLKEGRAGTLIEPYLAGVDLGMGTEGPSAEGMVWTCWAVSTTFVASRGDSTASEAEVGSLTEGNFTIMSIGDFRLGGIAFGGKAMAILSKVRGIGAISSAISGALFLVTVVTE